MKWYHQALIVLYSVVALYFLYMAAMHLYVYFANKSLGHEESFLVPGRNLAVGLLISGITLTGWYLLKHTDYSRLGSIVLFLPAVAVGLFLLYMVSLLIASGGKWN